MRPLTTLAALTLCVALSGCAMTFDATRLGVPVSLADAAQAPATGTPFSVTKHPVYVLWGAFSASEPNLEDLLSGQVGPGTALAQVRIRSRMSWTDLLFTVVTVGFLSPRSVTFEGVIVAPPAPAASH